MSRLTREARRAQILERALAVFADRGYHRASVSDVVKAAGVARGTFYLHFDSKEAVFHALLDSLLVRLGASVGGMDAAPDAGPMEQQLQAILVQILRTTEHNRALTRIIFREAVGLDEVVEAKLQGFHDGLHGWLVLALGRGHELGLLRETDSLVVASCVIGSVRQVIERYVVRSDEPFDAEAVCRAVVGYNLRGLALA